MTEIDLPGLTTTLTGDVLTPADEGYDEARAIWNARFDRRPAVIPASTKTPTSSGPFEAGVATSAWSPRSRCASTRSVLRS